MLMKLLLSLVAVLVAISPTLFMFLIASYLEPNGFWQKMFLFGVGFYFIGSLQIVMLILLIGASVMIWSD